MEKVAVVGFPLLDDVARRAVHSGTREHLFCSKMAKHGFDEEVVSYTGKSADNKNLCFRGILKQS
jgi:hypothetical protein